MPSHSGVLVLVVELGPVLVLDPLWLSADYQHVIHSAYNADRGPVTSAAPASMSNCSHLTKGAMGFSSAMEAG